jgi:putative transposase
MPRRARLDAPGTLHHVIIRGIEKHKMVDSLSALDRYPWSGHSSVMGHAEYDWHDTAYVLGWFGKRLKHARQTYRRFVEGGIEMGRQPHLVGGGLVRSAGGWSEVKALRRIGMREKGDDRILGGGDFVSQTLNEAELVKKYRLANLDREKAAFELIERSCQEIGISGQTLSGGSRLREVSKLRHELTLRLTEELGLSFAEIARLLGVSTSAIAKAFQRRKSKSQWKRN